MFCLYPALPSRCSALGGSARRTGHFYSVFFETTWLTSPDTLFLSQIDIKCRLLDRFILLLLLGHTVPVLQFVEDCLSQMDLSLLVHFIFQVRCCLVDKKTEMHVGWEERPKEPPQNRGPCCSLWPGLGPQLLNSAFLICFAAAQRRFLLLRPLLVASLLTACCGLWRTGMWVRPCGRSATVPVTLSWLSCKHGFLYISFVYVDSQGLIFFPMFLGRLQKRSGHLEDAVLNSQSKAALLTLKPKFLL